MGNLWSLMAIGHPFNLTDVVGWYTGNEAGFSYFYINCLILSRLLMDVYGNRWSLGFP